jgi:hypothetical protein
MINQEATVTTFKQKRQGSPVFLQISKKYGFLSYAASERI